jgi:hypothetical protein
VASALTWAFEPAGTGTRITLTVTAGGYLPGGFDTVATLVDGVLTGQVTGLTAYADRQASSSKPR